MAQLIIRHFTPQILRRAIRTSTMNQGSDYPTRSPYDILNNRSDGLQDVSEKQTSAFINNGKQAENEYLPHHHFNTHRIVEELEKKGFSKQQAVVIMKGMKFKLRESLAHLHQQLLLKSDLENESYLFKAAVSELRTEIQVMRQKDTQQLKTETLMITREVETLAQRLREDVDSMKNEIALDMDNCKNETRSDHKEIDMTIQELNSKFTVQMGEVRTGLESARWETIWKGLAGVAGSSITIVTLAYFLTNFAEKRAEDQRIAKQKRKKQMQEDARSAGLVDMEVVY